MERKNMDQSWEWTKGEPSNIPGMMQQPEVVHLPHDFMIKTDVKADSVNGADTGYFDGGTATYTKYIDAPEEWEGKRILAEFDGAFRDTSVILNGHVMGRHHYGYTPFCIDLTSRMNIGKKNRLAVVVSSDAQPNSRWYPGAGLYRHVSLLTAGRIHIAPYGIYAHTSHITGKDAFVIAEVTVENHTAEDTDVWVGLRFYKNMEENEQAKGAVKVHVKAGGSATARTQVMVENAAVWDIDSPDLYRICAQLLTARPTDQRESAEVLDQDETSFGIRTISADSKNGFLLNGRPLLLKGGCIHHDNGILGAASFYDSEYRKVKLHKDNGYNALRFSHNPVSKDMLDACDRLGVVVINEIFDTWNMPKNRHDYCRHFESEWKEEMTSCILRDRNHPSVVMWSIGNELPEQGGLSDGYETSAKLAQHVRTLDHTRLVTGALCSFFNGLDDEDRTKFWQSLMEEAQVQGGSISNLDGKYGREIWNDYTEAFVAPWDVVGYNYLNYHYEEAVSLFPDRVICCTESKPREMEDYWNDVKKYPHVIGDFAWTSHDYIGEAGLGKAIYAEHGKEAEAARMLHGAPYPWRTAATGEFDLCGFEKPQLAYRRIIWGSDETYLVCHNPANYDKAEILDRYAWPDCAHSWTWQTQPGSPVRVEVYSASDEVELFLNGRSIGRKNAGEENHFKAVFEVCYEPGVLEAVSYTVGIEISRDSIQTAGQPVGIKITPDAAGPHQTVLAADGQSLCFAVVEAVDADGNLVPYAEKEAEACVEGAASLAAFGTGRTVTEENYTVGKAVSYKGRMLAIVRAGYEPGDAKLIVKMQDIGQAVLEIKVV